ncbi:unnamed protein product [Caenorhabditis brenneri]
MIDLLLTVGLVLVGIWRMHEKERSGEDQLHPNNIRPKQIFEQSYSHQAFRVLLLLVVFINPSFYSKFAAIGVFVSVYIDASRYPLEPLRGIFVNHLYYSSRSAALDITYIIFVWGSYRSGVEVLGLLYFIKLVCSVHFTWNDILKGSYIDKMFWHIVDRIVFKRGNATPSNIPDYRKRINQWIGLALFADDRLVYCIAFCASSFFVRDFFARHRGVVRRRPAA